MSHCRRFRRSSSSIIASASIHRIAVVRDSDDLELVGNTLSTLSAMEIFQAAREYLLMTAYDARDPRIEMIEREIVRRQTLSLVNGTDEYWTALRDGWSLINGLVEAQKDTRAASGAADLSYCDTAYENFEGSYAEFEASRFDRAAEASAFEQDLEAFVDTFPMVVQIRAARKAA